MTDFINIWEYKNVKYPFQIFIGPRGSGKTYSALENCIKDKKKFIYMRRTQKELDLTLDSDKRGEGANPFRPINKNNNMNVGLLPINENLAGIYNRKEVDNKIIPEGAPIGYGVALSTVASIRGIDFSDCIYLIYDEFIPELHVRKLKNEGEAILNAYESINRNRELFKEDPLLFFLLANSNNIYNPLFITLNIVSDIEKMLSRNQKDIYFNSRGLAVHLIEPPESFKEKKAKSALYKLAGDSQFTDMALNNKFSFNDFNFCESRSLKGYSPVISLNKKFFLYKKKGEEIFYFSYASARCFNFNVNTDQGKRLFYQEYGLILRDYYTAGRIFFESYEMKELLLEILF